MKKILFIVLSIILSAPTFGADDNHRVNLSYGYNGNQLTKVDDTVSGSYYAGAFHFVDGTKEATEYSYDAKGNKHSVLYTLTAMTNTLPQMPVMQSVDAASANAVNGQKVINYCGNIIYDGDETIVLNDVGYVKYDKGGNLSFHYYLKDHLGDNRVVMSESGAIEQINDYYPTGALMGSSTNGDVLRYKYNGKELDRLNGLDWYDYGARNYDAALGIWRSQDNLQEIHPDIGSYVYVYNNPMRMADPDGQDGITNLGGKATTFGSAVAAVGTTAIVVTAGTSATVAAPITVVGKTITTAGLATSTAGYVMMANSNSNKAQGYNRGKKSNVSSDNKNSPHANQKRKEVNRQKYEQLKKEYDELKEKTNLSKHPEVRKQLSALERQIKRAKERMNFKGENHSRNSKGH